MFSFILLHVHVFLFFVFVSRSLVYFQYCFKWEMRHKDNSWEIRKFISRSQWIKQAGCALSMEVQTGQEIR